MIASAHREYQGEYGGAGGAGREGSSTGRVVQVQWCTLCSRVRVEFRNGRAQLLLGLVTSRPSSALLEQNERLRSVVRCWRHESDAADDQGARRSALHQRPALTCCPALTLPVVRNSPSPPKRSTPLSSSTKAIRRRRTRPSRRATSGPQSGSARESTLPLATSASTPCAMRMWTDGLSRACRTHPRTRS